MAAPFAAQKRKNSDAAVVKAEAKRPCLDSLSAASVDSNILGTDRTCEVAEAEADADSGEVSSSESSQVQRQLESDAELAARLQREEEDAEFAAKLAREQELESSEGDGRSRAQGVRTIQEADTQNTSNASADIEVAPAPKRPCVEAGVERTAAAPAAGMSSNAEREWSVIRGEAVSEQQGSEIPAMPLTLDDIASLIEGVDEDNASCQNRGSHL